MKQVWITVRGRAEVYYTENFAEIPDNWDDIDLDDFWLLENEWLVGELFETALITRLDGVYVGSDEWDEAEDITKQKGKYIKRTDVFKGDLGMTCPFYVRCINDFAEIVNSYCIEIPDDEEFDPSQLQLEKSDYEIERIPYGIVSQYVIYKGERIRAYTESAYNDKGWDRPFVCNEFYK